MKVRLKKCTCVVALPVCRRTLRTSQKKTHSTRPQMSAVRSANKPHNRLCAVFQSIVLKPHTVGLGAIPFSRFDGHTGGWNFIFQGGIGQPIDMSSDERTF